MKKIFILLISTIAFLSCNEDRDEAPQEFGRLDLTFQNVVDNQTVALDSDTYTNQSNEAYQISELVYIVSNIELLKSDNTTFSVPVEKSYFIIDEQGNKTASIDSIPVGNYTAITFGIGVEPTKYPIESGSMNFIPTAEEAGMLWSWSAGYKFLKFEGTYSTTVDSGDSNPFQYHVGSHGANLDNYKEIQLFTEQTIATNNTTNQTILFNIAKIFDSTFTLSLNASDDIQVDPINAPKVAENVRTAFRIE